MAILVRIEVDEIKQTLNLFLASNRRPSKEGWNKADVFFHCPMWEKSPVLLHVSDVTSERDGILVEGTHALNMNFPCGGFIEPIKQPQKCGFTRSTLANEDHGLPGVNRPVNILKANGAIRKMFTDVDGF